MKKLEELSNTLLSPDKVPGLLTYEKNKGTRKEDDTADTSSRKLRRKHNIRTS